MTTEEAEISGLAIMQQLEQRRAERKKDWNRNVFSVRTNDAIASSIKEYCHMNNVSPNQFINNLLKSYFDG